MNNLRLVGILFFLWGSFTTSAQISRATHPEEKALWNELKKECGFKKIFKKYKNYRFEIIFSQIDHSITGEVRIKNYFLGDSLSYFYPASTAKLPVAIAVAENMGKSPFLDIDLNMKLRVDTTETCGHHYENGMHEYHRVQPGEKVKDIAAQYRIPVADLCQWNHINETSPLTPNTSLLVYHRKSRPSIADLISEMLIYSDNESYNKLFELIGGKGMVDWMELKGFEKSNVTRKFLLCEGEEKSHSLSFDILNDRDVIFYHGNEQTWSPVNHASLNGIKVGKKYYWGDSLIKTPRDFSDHNRIPLNELHEMLQRLIFPHVFAPEEQYDMPAKRYYKLIKDLGLYPSEDLHPRDSVYDLMEDGKNIFLFNGNSKEPIPENYRMINAMGQAYGFSTDCMYFTDESTETEFFLSVRIYTNKDGVLNDDAYEYETIAMPLMENVGKYIFEKEKSRKKEVVPALMIIKTIFD